MPKPRYVPLIILSLLILCHRSHGHLVISHRQYSPSSRSDAVISDGVVHESHNNSENYLTLKLAAETESSTCEEPYGFLPCTTSVLGNLFLMVVYAYLMYTAATVLHSGIDLFLEILRPGIIGGLILPVIASFPDAMLILVSGVSGSTETAQSQVSVGMGLLAGSTVLILTLIWGSCVVVGKCNIEDSVAIDKKDTRGFSLTGSGVSTDIWTSYAAVIMTMSVIPFVIVQIPDVFNLSSSGRELAILVSLIASISLLLSYCLYQVFRPWIQIRRFAYVTRKHVMSGILQHLETQSYGRLIDDDGEPSKQVIEKVFQIIDDDGNERITIGELRAFLVGIRFNEIDLDRSDAAAEVMKDFSVTGRDEIDGEEFFLGISKWIKEANRASGYSSRSISDFHKRTEQECELVGGSGDIYEAAEDIDNPKRTSLKAGLMLLAGTLMAAAFADPLVDVVDNFSDASSIPTFFISFVVLPLATNTGEALSAIIFGRRKQKKAVSLTFSELYGSVTMKNALSLSVFLALVYFRGLTWDFSSEVLVILIVCLVMGVLGSLHTTFPLWTSAIAILFYPFSVGLVYVLDSFFGWS